MSNNKSNMQILRELIEKQNNDDFTDAEREKMEKAQKVYDELIAEIKSEIKNGNTGN